MWHTHKEVNTFLPGFGREVPLLREETLDKGAKRRVGNTKKTPLGRAGETGLRVPPFHREDGRVTLTGSPRF